MPNAFFDELDVTRGEIPTSVRKRGPHESFLCSAQ